MRVYFICIGKRRSPVGEFACMKAFSELSRALDECWRQFNSRGGGFAPDNEESDPEHVYKAWSSPTETIWLEQLELE